MANQFQAPRGTVDVLPDKTGIWGSVEATARDTAALFGFREIRFPTFENTELFRRGVGETTDVVQKEMFTFEHGKNSFTLRPEGTASTVRLLLENGLHNEPMPQKLYYITPCFRGERPQAGRLREFHQFGVEMFGAAAPAADVEIITLADAYFKNLGVTGLRLELNSIGCPTCRLAYQKALTAYFESRKDELCDTCLDRLDRNPMRILDCKSPQCRAVAEGAPRVLEFICDDCRAHFETVQAQLEALGIDFSINPSIVRGLDYYTRTVFEFIDTQSGLTLCGGGRYDGLVSELGGPALPGLGFGIGLERLLMILEQQKLGFDDQDEVSVYLASIGDAAAAKASQLAFLLRGEGISAEYDLIGRSVKAQMKYADRKKFTFTAVLGDNELAQGKAVLKNMKTGESTPFALDDTIVDTLDELMLKRATESIEKAAAHIKE